MRIIRKLLKEEKIALLINANLSQLGIPVDILMGCNVVAHKLKVYLDQRL